MIRFFDSNQIVKGKFFNVIEKLYPGFVNELNELKENNSIAHLTHRIEADLMVKGVGSLNIGKLLKHDEVLIYPENIEMVRKYIENKVKKELGINKINLK